MTSSETSSQQGALPNFEFDALAHARNYRCSLISEFAPYLRGRVIEVGAGVGQITEIIRGLSGIESLRAVEPNPEFCRNLRSRFPDQMIIQGTIEDVPKNTDCDAIININVLEHILEVDRELRCYHELLVRRNGVLNLLVPARQEIYAPIDRDLGHHRRFSKTDLRESLERAGFKIERLRYFNFFGYFAWLIIFCAMKRRHFNPRSVRFFDRVIFPCVHAFETKVMAPPIGQSLLAIARA